MHTNIQKIDRRSSRGRALAERLNRQTAIEATRFFVIADDGSQAYRVWQSGTPGDVFDVVPYEGSEVLVKWWKGQCAMFIFADPEEYSD